MIFWIGRTLQLIGLIAMPSAIWAGYMDHGEARSIAIFVASIIIFFIGFMLGKVK